MGWKRLRLESVISEGPSNGYSPQSGGDATGTLTLKLSATTSGRFVLDDTTTKRIYEEISPGSKFWLTPGDVLVQRSNTLDYVGTAALFDGPKQRYIYPDLMMRVRARKDVVEPAYLVKALNDPACRSDLRAKATGTAGNMPKINGETVRNLLVNIPPLPEQRRIVAKLDSLQARSRRAKEALDAIPPLLERLRQSVLAAAFRGDLTAEWRAKNPEVEPATELVARCPAPGGKSSGRAATKMVTPGRYAISVGHPGTEPPSGWAWVLLGSIARMESGHTPSREHAHYWSGGIPWIGIKDAREAHGATITTTSQTVSTEGLANSAARLLPAGTVCLSRTASVGYVTMMGRAMATSQDFANWVCGEALLPEYLMYALLAEGDGLREFGEGSTHTTIYFPELKALHLCLPPLAEQAEIVRALRDRLARVERLAQAAAETRELAPGLDRAILAKAFRGELVPQDPRESLEVEAPHPVVPLRSGEGQVVASPRAKGTKKRR